MRICKYTMVLFVYPIVSLRSKGFWWKKPGFSGCNRNVKKIWDMLVSPVQNLLELLQVRILLYWVNSVNSTDSYSVTLPVPVPYWSRSRRLHCVKKSRRQEVHEFSWILPRICWGFFFLQSWIWQVEKVSFLLRFCEWKKYSFAIQILGVECPF